MKEIVESCLYNWLGYGNVNGDIWFIGTEEGGAEIWRNQTLTLEESLHLRKGYSISMDFKEVWEEKYKIPLETFKGPNVWRYMAAFLLSMEGKEIDTKAIRNYIFLGKQLGQASSNHFLCELLPLPKKSKNDIAPYQNIWPSITDYYKEVLNSRFDLIRNTVKENKNIKLVIAYEFMLVEKVLDYFKEQYELVSNWKYKEEEYCLYKIEISTERAILLLKTPFFGNGRISYSGIADAVNRLKKEIKNHR